jgi:hypothetical protein
MSRIRQCRFLLIAILLLAPIAASAQELTVMELLQSPRQFEGRRVTVRGYYYSDWEGHAIFVDLKGAKALDVDRSIWIEANPNVESPICKTQISGVFLFARHFRPKGTFSGYGHMGMFPAALVNCTVHLQREATPAPNPSLQRTPTRRSPHISHE